MADAYALKDKIGINVKGNALFCIALVNGIVLVPLGSGFVSVPEIEGDPVVNYLHKRPIDTSAIHNCARYRVNAKQYRVKPKHTGHH